MLLQLQLIKFTAISDSWGGLEGTLHIGGKEMDHSACALFMYLFSNFCLTFPLATFSGKNVAI
jgi:hypothetical protein